MKDVEKFKLELDLDAFFRRNPIVLWGITVVTSLLLYLGIYWAMELFESHHYWSIFLSGLFAHAFFVITMHDGAHQSISSSKLDRFIMNTASGMIILPFYTELFRKYHLLHHAHTNTNLDPLWGTNKKNLFENHRIVYALLQSLPFVLNLAMIITRTKKEKQAYVFQPKVSLGYMCWSVVVAALVIYLAQPSLWFVLGTFGFMTSIGAVRYWGEHMGIGSDKQSNTHWFPLGMGIGNHEAHHAYPHLSWLTLTIGMWFRKKDTNPIKTVYRMFFDKRFRHYKK